MKNREKFFDKPTLIYTIICVLIISAIGCIFLVMEHINNTNIVKSPSSYQTEETIDKLHRSTHNKENEYSVDIFGLININSAQKEELMLLPGIGTLKADAIIEYRTNSPFKKAEDILKVAGISKKTFEKIKNIICVD